MSSEQPMCAICQRTEFLLAVRTQFLCERCFETALQERIRLWKEPLETLMEEFSTRCRASLGSTDSEDVHQARVSGRKLRVLLRFIGVPKTHPLVKQLKKVHALLTGVRENDVMLEELPKKNKRNLVQNELKEFLENKQPALQKQLEEKLPPLIGKKLEKKWSHFMQEELGGMVAALTIESQIEKNQLKFTKRLGRYEQTAAQHGLTAEKTVHDLHQVRIQAKTLRYMYSALQDLTGADFHETIHYYKALQTELGHINDLQDWLDQLEALAKEKHVEKKEVEKTAQPLQKELRRLLENVQISAKQPDPET